MHIICLKYPDNSIQKFLFYRRLRHQKEKITVMIFQNSLGIFHGIYRNRTVIAPSVDSFHLGVQAVTHDYDLLAFPVGFLRQLLYFFDKRTGCIDDFAIPCSRLFKELFGLAVRSYDDYILRLYIFQTVKYRNALLFESVRYRLVVNQRTPCIYSAG